jgi:hypothetical protein
VNWASFASESPAPSLTDLREDMEALKHNFLVCGFFKNRGYEDSDELTKHEIPKLPEGPYQKECAYDSGKLFDGPDSAKLKNPKALNKVGRFLEKEPFGLAVVTASTGMKGDTDKDRELTQGQSMVARNYLADHFRTDDTRIKTIGLGKALTGADRNRTEVFIYANGRRGPLNLRQHNADPASITQLSSQRQLDLSGNETKGTNLRVLSTLTNLTELDLGNNKLWMTPSMAI